MHDRDIGSHVGFPKRSKSSLTRANGCKHGHGHGSKPEHMLFSNSCCWVHGPLRGFSGTLSDSQMVFASLGGFQALVTYSKTSMTLHDIVFWC